MKQQKPQILKASCSKLHSSGFTLMEILVATTIFALVVTGMLSLFNYTLRINRRSEALRQATQGMRNFIEFIVKEVRNGRIYYGVNNSGSISGIGNCAVPSAVGGDTYSQQDNNIAILTPENDLECFYLAYGPGTMSHSIGAYVGAGYYAPGSDNPNPIIAMVKNSLPVENLTPLNVSVQHLLFLVRPKCDPYQASCSSFGGRSPRTQPFVTILAQFLVTLPTGEQTTIYYQTSVATNQYDLPSN